MKNKNITIIGVVTPICNQLFYTKNFLASLLLQELPENLRLVFVGVDNGSTDGTYDFLIHELDNWEEHSFFIISNKENLGFSKAVNQGISFLHKTFGIIDILITNNDMVLDPTCISNLFSCSRRYNNVGIVGGRLRFPDGTIQHAGAFLNAFGWGQHKGAGGNSNDTRLRGVESEEEYVTGALYFIKKDVFKHVNKFDEKYSPAYFEEVSFCYEVRKFGLITLYCPMATAIHYENVTGKDIYNNTEELKKSLSDVNQIKFYMEREEDLYIPTSNDKLLICSQIYGNWSFCSVMRNLAKGLSRNGVDVSIAPEEYHNVGNMEDWEIKQMILKPNDYWNRVVLRSSEGDHMYLMPPGKKRIAHTTGESSLINNRWKEQLNNCDLVLTTSNFFKEVLVNGGVVSPVEVLPNAVDTSLYNVNLPKHHLHELRGMNFCSVFHFGDRKGPDKLIQAFGEEFNEFENVSLYIHSLSMEYVLKQKGMSISQWISLLLNKKKNAPILVTSNYLREDVLAGILKNFDVFVLPTRGEGFGLPLAEVSSMGIPSIVTGYSGVLDIVDSTCGWLIDYELEDIPLQYLTYFKNYVGGKWADPSVEHLRHLLRYCYEHPEEVREKGRKAHEKAQQFSIENVGKKAKELIFK